MTKPDNAKHALKQKPLCGHDLLGSDFGGFERRKNPLPSQKTTYGRQSPSHQTNLLTLPTLLGILFISFFHPVAVPAVITMLREGGAHLLPFSFPINLLALPHLTAICMPPDLSLPAIPFSMSDSDSQGQWTGTYHSWVHLPISGLCAPC